MRLQQIVEARPHRRQLVRVELLGLHQDLLANPDLAEVVQERRVLELLQLPSREAGVGVGAGVHRVHDLGEPTREHADPKRVTAGGRIALLDRLHARADEALEDALDLVVEERVLQGDARLGGQRLQELLLALAELDDLRLKVLPLEEQLLRVPLLVDQLNDPDHVVFRRDHR